MKTVAILGCGPAGIFAAWAAERAGFEPVIYSKKRKSEMFGAQYLHQPIPDISGMSFDVEYQLRGTSAGYREKVYGNGQGLIVSTDELVGIHQAWDIRQAYSKLFDAYLDNIVDINFGSPQDVHGLVLNTEHSHYISTIPASMLCVTPAHSFHSQKVWAIGDAPERGIWSPIKQELNTVVCNGEKDVSWYRSANILGFHTAEWPEAKKPPIEGLSAVLKPIATDCDCLSMIMHRVGRYGKWTKGVLSHEAFYETEAGLKSRV